MITQQRDRPLMEPAYLPPTKRMSVAAALLIFAAALIIGALLSTFVTWKMGYHDSVAAPKSPGELVQPKAPEPVHAGALN